MGILSSGLSSAGNNTKFSAAANKRSQTPKTQQMPILGNYVKVSVDG